MGILVLALVIIAAVAIFSVQNASPVSIVFLFWRFQASLAIVIFIAALAGAVVASIVFLWRRMVRHGRKKKAGRSLSD
jgi:putative membrane protein